MFFVLRLRLFALSNWHRRLYVSSNSDYIYMRSYNVNQLNVYVPCGIQERARELKIKVSEVCRKALQSEIERIEADQIKGVVRNPNAFHRQDDDTTPVVNGE